MQTILFRSLVVAVFAGRLFQAAPCVAADAPPTTQQLIDQLNADDLEIRISAEAQLTDRGKAAIESLQDARSDYRPEVRQRALRALRQIELFRLREVPDPHLKIANDFLQAPDADHRKIYLDRLFECDPPASMNTVLTRLIPLEADWDLRHQMLYRLGTGYRDNVARIIHDDNDPLALLTVLDGAASMWGHAQAADYAVALSMTGGIDDAIARFTVQLSTGDIADRERAAAELCYLYRINGHYDEALKFARLSREQALIFLVLQDQGDWSAALKEPDERWRDPMLTKAFHVCFQRLAGHPDQAIESLSAMLLGAGPDPDRSLVPSKLFLLNGLPADGMNLMVAQHPATVFSMHLLRGEIPQALQIAEQYQNHPQDGTELKILRTSLGQSLGELPGPATMPADALPPQTADEKAWQSAVSALQEKKNQAAADLFGALWSHDRIHFDRLYLQGYALNAAGKTEQGQAFMHQAELMPLGNPLSRYDFAMRLSAAGLSDIANTQLNLALRTGGDFDEVGFSYIFNKQAENAIEQKQWQQAADALDRLCLIHHSPTLHWTDPARYLTVPAFVHLLKARAAQQRGDLPAAIRELSVYQQYLPASSEMVIEWTPALDAAGEHAQADTLFNNVYEKNAIICRAYPKSRRYLNQLAWMSACCGRRLDEALAAAQAAVDLKPDDDQMIDTLAEVRFRRGERSAAITLEKQAIGLSNDPYLKRQLTRFETAPTPSTTQPGVAPQ